MHRKLASTVATVATAATAALATLFVAPAFAGHPPGAPPEEFDRRGAEHADRGEFGERIAERHAERLTRALDLTEAQQATLESLQTTLGDTIRPILDSMRDVRDELEALLDAESPDATAVGTKAIELHRAKRSMKSAHDRFEADLVAMLTETQRAQYEALRDARPRRDRGERFREGFREPRR
jgi:Spy/CpxP family protein refolding chaperone